MWASLQVRAVLLYHSTTTRECHYASSILRYCPYCHSRRLNLSLHAFFRAGGGVAGGAEDGTPSTQQLLHSYTTVPLHYFTTTQLHEFTTTRLQPPPPPYPPTHHPLQASGAEDHASTALGELCCDQPAGGEFPVGGDFPAGGDRPWGVRPGGDRGGLRVLVEEALIRAGGAGASGTGGGGIDTGRGPASERARGELRRAICEACALAEAIPGASAIPEASAIPGVAALLDGLRASAPFSALVWRRREAELVLAMSDGAQLPGCNLRQV